MSTSLAEALLGAHSHDVRLRGGGWLARGGHGPAGGEGGADVAQGVPRGQEGRGSGAQWLRGHPRSHLPALLDLELDEVRRLVAWPIQE